MILTADNKGRIAARDLFPPGATFDASRTSGGQVVLVPMVKKPDVAPIVKLVRKDGRTRLVSDRTITSADVANALLDFP